MASNITLSAGVRSNLLNLQQTASLKDLTQGRLSTGKKVNSALDNPSNFFTAAALSSRSSDLLNLLDGISNGIQTLKAADNGIKSITSSIESLQATVRQARQDKSFKNASFEIDAAAIAAGSSPVLSISGGAVGATAVDISLQNPAVAAVAATATTLNGVEDAEATYTGGTLTINGTDVTIADDSTAAQIKTAIDAAGITGLTVTDNAGTVEFSLASGEDLNITASTTTLLADIGLTADGSTSTTTSSTNGTPAVAAVAASSKTVDQIVDLINGNSSLTNKVRASNDSGKLRIENLSTLDLSIAGFNSTTSKFDGTAGTKTVGGNEVRQNLVQQFNDVRDQLNKLADDSSFNGINLLRGDKLKLNFNETSTSSITIQSKSANGINTTTLEITAATVAEFGSDESLDARLEALANSLIKLRSESSEFGSKLSIVQNRQDFTKALTNTLQVGADNLTLADTNEEGANLLALNTRQQLQTTSLSFASQADQAVLQFLR
jgi:flagellin-like hook-associated protein FlgL